MSVPPGVVTFLSVIVMQVEIDEAALEECCETYAQRGVNYLRKADGSITNS